MPIYEYKDQEHPAGFVGLRVAVSVNGQLRQRYFNYRLKNKTISAKEKKRIRAESKKLHQEWETERELERQRRVPAEKRPSKYSTGIAGIKIKRVTDIKERAGELRSYSSNAIVCQIRDTQGENVSITRRFRTRRKYFEARNEILSRYIDIKDLDSGLMDKMKRKWPSYQRALEICEDHSEACS